MAARKLIATRDAPDELVATPCDEANPEFVAPADGHGAPRRGLLYLLFLLSGMAALIYQAMWLRSFSLVFGSASEATSAVLAAFFAGLALGSWIGARLATDRTTALRRYGMAEFGIAAGALLVPLWIHLFSAVYPALYASGLADGWGMTAVKLVLAFIAIGIPCVAMGATLPLIIRALVGAAGHFGRRAGFAYALNTLGATIGVLLAAFVLPPRLGTINTVYAAAALNVAVGVAAIALARGSRRGSTAPVRDSGEPGAGLRRRADRGVLVGVTVSGFGTLSLEVLYTRLLVNITDSSTFSFALMLATFLMCLALASLVTSVVIDRIGRPWRFLAWTQTLGLVAIMAAPMVFQHLFDQGSSDRERATSTSYFLGLMLRSVAVMGPAALLVGTALPTAWRIATRGAADSGRNVGRLTGLNTLAAVVGSVGTGFVIVPLLGIGPGIVLIASLYGMMAVVCWFRGYGRGPAVAAGVGVAILLGGLGSLKTWDSRPIRLQEGQELVYLREGKSVTVAVIDDEHGNRILKVNNHYNLGGTGPVAVAIQRGQGGLPLLLHRNPVRVAFIGVATGVSVSAVLEFPVKRVVAIELLPEVMEATAYFEDANRGVLRDPRTETVLADGRNHLFATRERFDVIVGDLFVPWHAGTGSLYTTEHFRTVARRLAQGGIFVQWLPGQQLTVEQLRMIVATFLDVFPNASLWLNIPNPRGPPILGLVGYANAGAGPSPADRRRVASSSTFRGLRYVCGVESLQDWAASAPRNSDVFPRVEYAGASRFGGREHRRRMQELIRDLHLSGRSFMNDRG